MCDCDKEIKKCAVATRIVVWNLEEARETDP